MGMSRTTLYQYLRGEAIPGSVQLKRLTDVGCNASWLLTGDGTIFAENEAGTELRRKAIAQESTAGSDDLDYRRVQSKREEGEEAPNAFWDAQEMEGTEMHFPLGKVLIPLMLESVSAGAPMPAEDTVDKYVDIEAWLAPNPKATLIVRAKGASMLYDMIDEGDYIVLDRSIQLKSGLVVVASLRGDLLVKRYELKGDVIWLMPANPKYKGIEVKDARELKIWGVVRQVIHSFRVV